MLRENNLIWGTRCEIGINTARQYSETAWIWQTIKWTQDTVGDEHSSCASWIVAWKLWVTTEATRWFKDKFIVLRTAMHEITAHAVSVRGPSLPAPYRIFSKPWWILIFVPRIFEIQRYHFPSAKNEKPPKDTIIL